MKKNLELIGLKVKDLRNIDLVDVELKGQRFIEIVGKNGAAKTTFIDSIFLALQGTKYLGTGFPGWRLVNSKADKALLKVIIGNKERTIEVKRSITKKEMPDGGYSTGGSLTITDTDGNKLGQEFLDNLISEFTVDPVSFSLKAPKEQIEILKRLGKIDTTELDNQYAEAYASRTAVNRELKELEPKVRIQPAKVEKIDVSEASQKYSAVLEKNEKIREEKKNREAYLEKTAEKEQLAHEKIKALKKLQEEIEILQAEIMERKAESTSWKNLPDIQDAEQYKAALERAATQNEAAGKYVEWEQNFRRYELKKKEQQKYEEIIKNYPEEKKKLIQNSALPFKNLEFSEDIGLLIDGIPFNQKSDAEKIRISTRIGMEMKPEFKIICIKNGSLLDDNSLKVVRELAEKYDYQVLVERVEDEETEGENKIVMRAGKVISEFSRKKSAKQTAEEMENNL